MADTDSISRCFVLHECDLVCLVNIVRKRSTQHLDVASELKMIDN